MTPQIYLGSQEMLVVMDTIQVVRDLKLAYQITSQNLFDTSRLSEVAQKVAGAVSSPGYAAINGRLIMYDGEVKAIPAPDEYFQKFKEGLDKILLARTCQLI